MLRCVRRSCAVAALVTVIGVTSPGIAAADPAVECAKSNPRTGACVLWVSTPGSDSTGPVSRTAEAVGNGETTSPNPCTYTVADPQPWSGHPVWAGHRPEDGTIWLFTCPRPDGFGPGVWSGLVFLGDGAEPPVGPAVDPRTLAQEAIASMTLRAPEIGMAPPPGSASGLVGLPVWMWVERGADTTGPARASASAGGVTVTAVAQVSQVLWDMGDGNAVTCGLGTPYADGAGTASPDCGYVYAKASSRHVPDGGPWPITATGTWTVTWSGGGLSGTETLELSSTAELLVGELHVLNQDGDR